MPPTSFLVLLAALALVAIFGPGLVKRHLARKRAAKPDHLEERALASVRENGGVYAGGEISGQPSRNYPK